MLRKNKFFEFKDILFMQTWQRQSESRILDLVNMDERMKNRVVYTKVFIEALMLGPDHFW